MFVERIVKKLSIRENIVYGNRAILLVKKIDFPICDRSSK